MLPVARPSPSTELSLRLPFRPESARVARVLVVPLLQHAGAAAVLVSDAALVVHELVANAIRHGGPDDRASVRMYCSWGDGLVDIKVVDHGHAGIVAPLVLTSDAPSGRGLAIVASLASTWGVDRTVGTCVWARLAA